MQFLIFIIFFQLISISFQQKCVDYDIGCFPEVDNFITSYLSRIPKQQILEEINQGLKYYSSLDIYVKETEEAGLGLFMNKDIQKFDIIVKCNKKKIIGSQYVNFALFFQNSMSIQLKKFTFKLYRGFQQLDVYPKYQLIINFYLHYLNIDKSMLRSDLLGVPLQNKVAPIYKIQQDEFQYLDYELLKEAKHQQKLMQIEFNQFKFILNKQLTKEQITFIFQDDQIRQQDYLYFDYLHKSRCYLHKNKLYLIPLYHYANQIQNIQTSFSNSHQVYKNKVLMIKSSRLMYYSGQNSEYLYNYGYKVLSEFQYVFQGGFLPNIHDLYCMKLDVLNPSISKSYKLLQKTCIDAESFEIYSMAMILNQMREFKVNQCEKKVADLTFNDTSHKLMVQFQQCKDIYKKINIPQLWEEPLEQIDELEQDLQIKLVAIQEALPHKKDHLVLKLLTQYYKYQLNKIENAKINLKYFIDQNK